MTDHAALPELIAVMAAAGAHDAEAVARHAQAALAVISRHRIHKARPDIEACLSASQDQNWTAVWASAHRAMCGLTGPFPPDISLCPPAPGPAPHVAATCSRCQTHLAVGARFCHACGTPHETGDAPR